MPRDCTVYHWNHCEQSRYVAGSHTNQMTNGSVHGPKLEKILIDEICTAAHLIEPALPKAVCKRALKQAVKLGKKLPSPKELVKAAREMLDFDRPGPLVEKTIAWARRKAPTSSSSTSSTSGTSFVTSTMAPAPSSLGGTSYAPVSVSHNIRKTSKPKMRYSGDAVIISHSEMLGSTLSGAPTSNVTAFRCFGARANPGLSTLFPWLSATAVNYEKYRFNRLSFTLVPLVSTNFSGRIGVGFDYDSTDVAPANRQEFYALTNHAEGMPWQATSIAVRCDRNFKFTGTHVAADNKLVDQGQVILMSDSISNGGTISSAIPLYDVIVDYEVELKEPQQSLYATQLYRNPAPAGGSLGANGTILGIGGDTTLVFGPNVIFSVVVTSASVVTVNLPAGSYVLSLNAVWSAGAATISVASTTSTIRSIVGQGTSFALVNASVQATTDTSITFTVGTVSWQSAVSNFSVAVSRVSGPLAQNF